LLSPPFHDLEELDLLGWNFPRVPKWMGSFLRLGLMLKETTTSTDRSICWEEDMNVIGRLPSLVLLWLRMPVALTERTVIGSAMGFVVLEQFFIDCCGISHLTFEAGTDPEEWDKAPPAGLGHLSSLKEIRVFASRPDNSRWPKEMQDRKSGTELIKAVLQEAVDALPNCPTVIAGW
jgi:hypothetical protein